MSFFDTCFEKVIGVEGGLVNDPRDPGGLTKYGISSRAYPGVDIKGLTLDQAKAIYWADYWNKLSLSRFDKSVAYLLFDIAVNSGVGRVRGLISECVDQDNPHSSVLKLLSARLRLYTSANLWGTYGKGWVNRVAANMDFLSSIEGSK